MSSRGEGAIPLAGGAKTGARAANGRGVRKDRTDEMH
jgi:hypothetical protein